MSELILKDKVTILVCTCDSYEDLWLPFFKLLDKYWKDNDLTIVLNTETKTYAYRNLNIVSYPQTRKETYGERIIRNIQHIETKYTLLLLDDFFLRRNVDTIALSNYIEIMNSDDKVDVIYFTKQILGQVEEYSIEGLMKLKKYAMYRLNMQAGLWRTDRLLELWKPIDNPWKWEIFANYMTFDSNEVFLEIDDEDKSPFFYGYNKDGMGVFRGKWVYEDVKPLFDENDIDIDYQARGIYNKEEKVNYFGNKLDLLKYMIIRMPLKYIVSFVFFYARKNIHNAIKKNKITETHCEYLIRKNEL